MNWFTKGLDALGSGGEHLLHSGEHALGSLADGGAHLVGQGLDDVGLHGAAQWAGHAGDQIADHLGAEVPELELGQSDDPKDLIHGDPGGIGQSAGTLRRFSGAFGETASGLAGMDSSHWTGEAADAFRSRYAPQPKRWADAQSATGTAADALDSYGRTVSWAQGQAKQAIDLYDQGNRASAAARSAYDQQVSVYNQAARAYDAKLSAGQDPGQRPVEPGPFSDPGEAMRQQAQGILAQARAQRDSAAGAAASEIRSATGLAPPEPSFTHRMLDDMGDLFQGGTLADVHLTAGIVKGAGDIVKFARSLNVLDPYNVTHLPQYAQGLSDTGAGLLHDAMHPVDLVKSLVGSGWGSDPAEALGRLVPNVALAVGTDGAGTAADAGTDIAERAAMTAGRDGVQDAGAAARAGDDIDMVNDPVDVATGQVVMRQADVTLPGALPLLLERMHRSSYRIGRWFGPSWASTLDQRLEVDDEGVIFAAADGMVLCYPHAGGEAVFATAGPRWPLARDAGGYTVTDPQAGLVWRFEPVAGHPVTASGRGVWPLVSVTDRVGHQISFGYDATGAPAEVRHSGGYRIRVTTAHGRVVGLSLVGAGPDGRDVDLAGYLYDAGGHLSAVFNSSARPLRLHHDGQGRLTGWTDRNGVAFTYSYDPEGRCVATSGPAGIMGGTFRYDSGARVTTFTDSAGAVTTYRTNSLLRVIEQTDPLGDTVRQEWDGQGRLAGRTDPLGRVTRYGYDSRGNLAAVTRPDGAQATAEYNERNLPVAVTEPAGAVWRHEYDALGNLAKLTGPDGAVTGYVYDGRGHLAAVTDPLGNTARIDCDAAGLPVAVTEPGGARTACTRNGLGQITEITGPGGEVTRLSWAIEGQLMSRTLPDGSSEHFAYDGEGNLVAHTGPGGELTRAEYGPFDAVTAQTGPDGTRIEFSYDQQMRLTTVALPGGTTWRYEYDAAGRLSAETDCNGAITRYTHDAAGQLTQRVNAAGQAVAYTYGPLGNLAQMRAGDAVTAFGHDAAGRLVRATGPGADVRLEWDAAGRLVAETCNGATVACGYDAAGRRVSRRTPSGATSTWEYDPSGRPVALHAAGHTVGFGYDRAGREIMRGLPGVQLAQRWDPAGRLAGQALTTAGATGRLLQRRDYRYRRDGRLASVDDMLAGPRRLALDPAGRITAITGPDWAERYGYDPAGNMISAAWPAPPAAAAAGALHQDLQGPRTYTGTLITGCGATRYQHDACGRVTVRSRSRISRKPETWQYTWDAGDRLTGVTTPDGTRWRYVYDPFGRRIAKQRLTAGGAVAEQTTFVWDGDTIAEQATTAGPGAGGPGQVITWDYQPGTFTPLAQTERLRRAPQDDIDTRFYAMVTDLVGTPTELVAPGGTLAGYQQHTLWGATVWNPAGASTPLRFPGQYHDPETHLHYNNQRYYDPATGRYLTPDPLGLTPAPNPHTYVPNPTHHIDPLGLQGTECPAGAGGGDGWTIKGRMRAAGPGDQFGLPAQGRIRYVPPRDYNPLNPLPRGPQGGYIDRFGNEWVVGPSRTPGQPFEWDVQLSRTGRAQLGWLSRDGAHVNVSPSGEVTH